jgi:hypothetical protein
MIIFKFILIKKIKILKRKLLYNYRIHSIVQLRDIILNKPLTFPAKKDFRSQYTSLLQRMLEVTHSQRATWEEVSKIIKKINPKSNLAESNFLYDTDDSDVHAQIPQPLDLNKGMLNRCKSIDFLDSYIENLSSTNEENLEFKWLELYFKNQMDRLNLLKWPLTDASKIKLTRGWVTLINYLLLRYFDENLRNLISDLNGSSLIIRNSEIEPKIWEGFKKTQAHKSLKDLFNGFLIKDLEQYGVKEKLFSVEEFLGYEPLKKISLGSSFYLEKASETIKNIIREHNIDNMSIENFQYVLFCSSALKIDKTHLFPSCKAYDFKFFNFEKFKKEMFGLGRSASKQLIWDII